jgi:hypothetical protein
MVESQMLAIDGHPDSADAVLCKALDEAPPGFAAWTLPVESLLLQPARTKGLPAALLRLSERAR